MAELLSFPGDQFHPRGHQRRMAQRVVDKIDKGERILIGDIFPGSGKTAGYLHALNMLYRAGVIDSALIVVPRINLAVQVEQDWMGSETKPPQSGLYVPPVMGKITHRPNEEPLLDPVRAPERFGYVTTYASLCSNPGMHIRALRGRRFALVLDESQQLGSDDQGGTRGAEVVAEIGDKAAFIISVSGTSYRADNKPLLYAEYSDPDEEGKRTLLSDVSATYAEGVESGYLRPFEFVIADGAATEETLLTGAQRTLVLAEMEQNIRQIIQHDGYWQGMVDLTVDKLRAVQEGIDGRLSGLIGASDQRHARDIERYLKSNHPTIRSLVAISDDTASHERLRLFRRGGHDILITVAMAHVGYDCPQVTVVCMLNDFREWGWVVQFLMRGGRVWKEIDRDVQTLLAIIPGDQKAVSICETLRGDSNQALFERTRRERVEESERSANQGGGELSTITESRITGKWAMGPQDDLAYLEYEQMDRAAKQSGLESVPLTKLKRFMNLFEVINTSEPLWVAPPSGVTITPAGSSLTEREKEKAARVDLSDQFRRLAPRCWSIGIGEEGDWSVVAKTCFSEFGSGVKGLSLREIEDRRTWLTNVLIPMIEREEGRRHGVA